MKPDGSSTLAEWAGPIVVKEVRQGIRSRVFAVVFGLVLFVELAVAISGAAKAIDRHTVAMGRQLLAAYLAALGLVTHFVMPFSAFRSMIREREEETWVLIVLTGLGADSIIRGKWLSAMSQVMLFGSAFAPFVVFSYFLNGVDLITIMVALALSASWSALTTSLALALASQAESRLMRSGTQLSTVFMLGFATFLGVAFTSVLATEGARLLREPGFAHFCAAIFLVSVGSSAVVLEGASASLALPSEAASRRPRIVLSSFIVSALCISVPMFIGFHADSRVAVVGVVYTSLYLTIAGVFAISERDGSLSRFAGDGWLKPGALRSFSLILGLFLLSGLVWTGLFINALGERRYLAALVSATLFPPLYLALGTLVGRLTPLARLGEPRASRVGFVACTLFGILTPPLVATLSHFRAGDRELNALNPLIGMFNTVDNARVDDPNIGILALTTLFATAAAFITLKRHDRVLDQ